MKAGDVLDQIDDALADWSVGPDAMRCGASPRMPRIVIRADLTQTTRAFADLKVALKRMADAYTKVAQALLKNPAFRRAAGLPVYDKHHPRPLCIDGAAYRRRTKKRR